MEENRIVRRQTRGRAKVEEECWYGVQDPKKRKKIQDRLAQRARRKRLASSSSSSSSLSSSCSVSVSVSVSVSEPPRPTPATSQPLPPPFSLPIDHKHLAASQASLSLLSALHTNGLLLGIPCATSSVALSHPLAPHSTLPPALHPTAVQKTVPHFSFIDRYPFAGLRDRMILRCDRWSAEAFMADIFGLRTWVVTGNAWEPESWAVDLEWRKRWAVLFDE